MVSHRGKTTEARRFTSYHSVTTKQTNDHSPSPKLAIRVQYTIRHYSTGFQGGSPAPGMHWPVNRHTDTDHVEHRCRNVGVMLP